MGAAFTVSGERVQFAEAPCPWYPGGVVPRTKILATLGPATASEEAIRTLVDAGFKFQRVKVTDEGCYELKGTNTLGDRVEIYLNPADGTNVRTETKRS